MDTVRHDEESRLLDVARKSRRARARMLRAQAESKNELEIAAERVIDITERQPKIRLFARSPRIPESSRPFTPRD